MVGPVEARSVEINGRTVLIERFTLAKAMRVITLLKLIQQQVPDVVKHYNAWRRTYADEYAREVDRNHAVAQMPWLRENLTDEDWERAGQKFKLPGSPGREETFFEMAPLVYEKAESVTLRLLGLLALENEVVNRYVKSGDIWDRVDEFVDETIRTAPLDEIMELVVTAAEVIDGQVLQKAKGLGDRAGNVARLLGMKTTSPSSEDSTTLSEQPAQPNTVSVTPSPDSSSGGQTESSDSPGISSSRSTVSLPASSATV